MTTKKPSSPVAHADYPLVAVRNLDNPDAPPRLISLPPDEAVLWCYADDIGQRDRYLKFHSELRMMDGLWICGRYACPSEKGQS